MSRFIQALECRALLSVSTTSLANDLTNVNTDAAALKADLATLQSTAAADLKTLRTDLKSSKSGSLLSKLAADGTKYLVKLKSDVNALLKETNVSAKGVKDGDGVLATPNNLTLRQNVRADVKALGTTTTLLSKLTADASTTGLTADITAITSANPSNTSLANDAGKAKNDLNNLSGKLVSYANHFSSAEGTLETDLTPLEPIVPMPTTTPSLVGDYKGTLKTKPVAFGLGSVTVSFELNITSQTLNSLTGTISISGASFSGTMTATELTNGQVNLKINSSGVTVTLNGSVNIFTTKGGAAPGTVITGSGQASLAGVSYSGTFSATKS
jgi:hypothetical protein